MADRKSTKMEMKRHSQMEKQSVDRMMEEVEELYYQLKTFICMG